MSGHAERIEDSIRQALTLLEHPTADAVEACVRLLEPCVAEMEALQKVAAGGGDAEAVRGQLDRIGDQLQRVAALMRHAVEFQVECAVAGVQATPGYTPRGMCVPEWPVRRLRVEG